MTKPIGLRGYVDLVLERVSQEQFGRREGPRLRLIEAVEHPNGSLSGVLEIGIRIRNGNLAIIDERRFASITTVEQVDDLFADVLSVLLMDHMKWPR